MSLLQYFGRKKTQGNNNSENLCGTSKDNEGNLTGTAEQRLPEESSKKRLRAFQDSWSSGRPWLEFDEKQNSKVDERSSSSILRK